MKKNVLMLCALVALFGLGLFASPHITHALEIHYPDSIPGLTTPTGAPANPNDVLSGNAVSIGDVFQFLFTLALWAIGLLAFGSLLAFGFLYETSSGNPAKRLRAKERFKTTLLGVMVLLGFTIILRAVNPELALLPSQTFNPCINAAGTNACPTITPPNITQKLTYVINSYNDSNCCGQNGVTLGTNKAQEQERYLAAFNVTPGIAPCSQVSDCTPINPGPTTIEFFQADLQYVLDNAKKAGVNPVFAVAVWRAGTLESDGSNSFGCLNATYTGIAQQMPFLDSFNCFTDSVKASGGDFVKWLSAYCDPTHTDKLICHERPTFMTWLGAFYSANAGIGGSGFGLLGASETGTAQAPPNNTPIENASFSDSSGSPTGVAGTGVIGQAAGGSCTSNNECFEEGAKGTQISLVNFPSAFFRDCKSSSCRVPSYLIPHIYDQRQVSVPEFNCPKGPQSVACGPTSLAMIAESFNGPDANSQTANNLTRFFLENDPPLMNCGGSINSNIQNYANLTDQADQTIQVRVQAFHTDSSFSDLENYFRSTGNPILTGVWWGGFGGGVSHYTVVAGVSDNFVWLADPLLAWNKDNSPGNTTFLGSQVILQIPKQEFINSYWQGVYWEIAPRPN